MASVKRLLGWTWRKFRQLPVWGQVLVVLGIVLIVITSSSGVSDDEPVRPTNDAETNTPTTGTGESDNAEPPSLAERAQRSNDGTLSVSEQDFGSDWPLTVNSGLLSCRRGTSAVVFGTDDVLTGRPPKQRCGSRCHGAAAAPASHRRLRRVA